MACRHRVGEEGKKGRYLPRCTAREGRGTHPCWERANTSLFQFGKKRGELRSFRELSKEKEAL